jgi:Tol biopolymer transport system component
VVFGEIFAEELFRAPAALPQFSDVTGGLNEPVEAVADAPAGRDALGELYFFTSSRHANEPYQLVRLPGLCVVGLAECPQLETVTAPFTFDFNPGAFSWSPDGNFAAFIYPADENGTLYKLWLFDPAAETWTVLFESSSLDSLSWSPDGNWIAFRMQDDPRGSEVYAIRRDGSGLKNLTPLDSLPDDGLGLGYTMDGWINESVVVHSGLSGSDDMIYSVRVIDGQIEPMFEASLFKSEFKPSNDGVWLAYSEHNQESNKLTLFVRKSDGTDPLELASFSTDKLWLQIVWSPDNNQLAFVNNEFAQGNPSADVYVIGRDGKGLKQVGRALDADGGILFSPDGKFLLINEMTGPTGQRLFLVNLETLEQRIIQAPGLSLDGNWSLASWRAPTLSPPNP